MRSAAARFAGEIASRSGNIIIRGVVLLTVFAGTLDGAGAASVTASDPAEGLFSIHEPVPHLSIEVSVADFRRLGASTSVRDDSYRPEVGATVREGTNVYKNVVLHLKGARGSFRSVDDKPALTLRFSENNKHQRFHGLEKISLNNSVQDSTYLCEWLGRRAFLAADIPVPRAAHATVSLNGRQLGLYVLLEGWNKQFLRRHFADPSGNFYEPAFHQDIPGPFEVKSGDSPENHVALQALATALETPAEQRWAALAGTLDRDRFVTGMALEILLQHWDGYCGNQNNYRIFHDRASGHLVFIPHGLDQLFGLRRPRSGLSLAPQMRGRVAEAILESSEGLERYYDRAGWLLTNVWNVSRWKAEVQQMAKRLQPLIDDENNGSIRFEQQVNRLLDQISTRHAEASRQLAAATAPIKFVVGQPTVLRNWSYWRADNSFGMGFRQRDDGPGYLRLSASRWGSPGAWRTTALLEPGHYRFDAQAECDPTSTASDALNIRSSVGGKTRVDPEQRRVSTDSASAGRVRLGLSHDFSLNRRRFVEFLCEAGRGTGWIEFDPESLKLSRLP